MKIRILTLTLLVSCLIGNAQIKEFSSDPAKYIPEMTSLYTILENKTQKKNGELFMLEKFGPYWNSGVLSAAQKTKIIATSNSMLKKKMKAYPHFMNYMTSLMNLKESDKLTTAFDAWHETLAKLMTKSTSNSFLKFLETSDSLFLANYLYKSNSTEWVASNNNYQFTFEDEPVIIFPSIDLICYANKDSSVIYNTKGKYFPLQKKFYGSNGKVDWTRAGFKPSEVYCELKNYTIDLKTREYRADSVTFYNTEFFGSTPLFGYVEEKVLAARSGEKAIYPAFRSYDQKHSIKNIYENVDYEGGFSMIGSKLLGTGDENYDAKLIFYKDGQPFLISRSKSFAVRKDRVNSDRASVTIHFKGDSIYHTGLVMKYLDEIKEVSFSRIGEGLAQSPFYDSYHKLEMQFEAMYWKLYEHKIDFSMLKGPGKSSEALFESVNYYSEARFEKIRGIDELDPLSYLKKYSLACGKNYFSVLDFASFRRIQVEVIRAQIVDLAIQGFIDFDTNKDMIYIKDKTFDYISCKAKKSDYDVLRFNSIIEAESNATLSLLNYDLKMRGISRVFLSDSQLVYIYPEEQEIIMKQNRDFTFAGRIHAGKFDYYGKNFSFEYDKFQLNLPVIDSMTFKVKSRTPDDYGYYNDVLVKSVVEDLQGEILIDAPNNKSGLKYRPEYPIFNSKKHSYVYYDKNSAYKGKYPRENFFYRLDPFVLKRLDDFQTDSLRFTGYLSSADIFPDITEPLIVTKDYSLGFIKNTGASGLPTYNQTGSGKGTFIGDIDLSYNGLYGHGTLKYLTSESKAEDFLFFPDGMTAKVQEYVVKEQKAPVQYPPVTAKNVDQEWKPYEDVLSVHTNDIPARIFAEDAELQGTINTSPSGMSGSGIVEYKNAIMKSNLYRFKTREFDTDTCDFSLKAMEEDELAFNTKNYKGHVNFDDRKGEFKSNGGTSLVEFPANMYICYMDQFDWFMDSDEIEMKNNDLNIPDTKNMDIKQIADLDLSGSQFVSTHPAQDSLRFHSQKAKFSLKEKIIQAYDVAYIKVADATIFPNEGRVTILKKAEMLPLENSTILANNTNKYHEIYNAKTNIHSSKKYISQGTYNYIDENEKIQTIYFDNVGVDSTIQTYAKGFISDSVGFTLSPYFEYKGNVNLTASHEFLNFDGGTRVSHSCDTLPNGWLKFNAEINPKEIFIPIPDQPYDYDGSQLFVGLFFSNDSVGVYPTLLNKKYYGGDPELASSSGFLIFDKQSKEYRVASKEKLAQTNLPGRYFSLNVDKCVAKTEGKMTFGYNLGRVKMSNYGLAEHTMRDDKTMIYTVSELDFHFNDDATKVIVESLNNSGLEATNVQSELYMKYIGEILEGEEYTKTETDLSLYGYLKKMPAKMKHSIVFSDLALQYNPKTRSYVSTGKIGIASFGETQINKYVNGKIEVIQKRGGDRLTMYLELSPSEWYFFYYNNGLMQALSSNKEWNKIITDTPSDKRELKAGNGEKAYNYYISSEARKKKFLEKTDGTDLEEEEE